MQNFSTSPNLAPPPTKKTATFAPNVGCTPVRITNTALITAKMKIEVNATDVNEKKADDRGRVTLGADYAGKTVTVAVVEIED